MITEQDLHEYNRWLMDVWNPNQLYIPFAIDAPSAFLRYKMEKGVEKLDIYLTRDDLKKEKKHIPFDRIDSEDFKESAMSREDFYKAKKVVFVDGEQAKEFKNRYKTNIKLNKMEDVTHNNENTNDTKPVLSDSKISVGDKVRVEKGNRSVYTVQHIIGKVVWFEETNDNCFLDECTKVG